MEKYIGVKIINAMPMIKSEAYGEGLVRQDGRITTSEGEEIDGYKVIYEDNYVSWSPKEIFELAYRPTNGMTFGLAIEALKKGHKVARKGWVEKDMFLFLVPGSKFKVNRPPLLGIYEDGTEISYHTHIDMKTAQGDIIPWLASQADMLAEDWVIVNDCTMTKLKLMDKGISKRYERNTDIDDVKSVSLSSVSRSIYPSKRNYSEKHRKLFKKFLEV